MTFILVLFVKSTLVLLTTIALLLLLKRSSASLRHWVISLCLLGILLLPVLQFFTPKLAVELPVMEQLQLEDFQNEGWHNILEPAVIILNKQDVYKDNPTDTPSSNVSEPIAARSFYLNWKQVLVSLWLLGGTYFLLRILLPIFQLHKWLRSATRQPLPKTMHPFIAPKNIAVYHSQHISTPMTFGLIRPKILLPNASSAWSPEQLHTVLLHELGHIKRKDYLFHLLGLLTLSLYWFHPLVWLLQKWQQQEREKACDEFVLRQGVTKTFYAESLVQVARNMVQGNAKRWDASLPMAATSMIKQRVLAILKFDRTNWRFDSWLKWRWVGFFACITPVLAAMYPTSREILTTALPQLEAVLEKPVFSNVEEGLAVLAESPTEVTSKKNDNPTVVIKAVQPLASLPLQTIESPERPLKLNLQYQPPQVAKSDLTLTEKPAVPIRYGKWEKEDKVIEVWTRGNYKVLNSFPYFNLIDDDGLIIVSIKEKKAFGKCCKEVVIQKLQFDKAILVNKPTQMEGVPIPVGTTLYNYNSFDKSAHTIAYSETSGVKVSNPKKEWSYLKTDWKIMGMDAVTKKIKSDPTLLQPIQADNEKWSLMNSTVKDTPGLQNIRRIQDEGKWQDHLNSYFLKQAKRAKSKKKERSTNLNLPDGYVYIPSGKMYSEASGKTEALTVQGFHIAATEISNKEYRTFLSMLQLEGNMDLLKIARIHNENFVVNGKKNEPWAATYHIHPAFDDYPVVNISYEGAKAYCDWLTQLYNKANEDSGWNITFRLPTKQEWIYAARGGFELVPYPWGSHYIQNNKGCDLCNYRKIGEGNIAYNSLNDTYEVKGAFKNNCSYQIQTQSVSVLAPTVSYFPNDFGIYNMSGNAAEMLLAKGSTKGGSWNSTGYHVRIDAEDEYTGWEDPNPFIGFRPVIVMRCK